MKIALASEGMEVSAHFGHCALFTIVDVEDGAMIKQEQIPNPGHGHGTIPAHLKGIGVSLVISGGMGEGAYTALQKEGIDIVTGAKGAVTDVVNQYLAGELESLGVSCKGHTGGCGGHHHE